MIDHEKKWLLVEDKSRFFYEKDFKNVLTDTSHHWYDFFYKEMYALEFSPTNCIYERDNCIIEPDDVVVDLGANVGFFSDYAAKKCKRIISVEGGDGFFACLIKNTYHNTNIEYLNANVVSETSKINRTWANPSKINVTISDIFNLYNLEKIDFLKIDIEGSEYDIFRDIDKNILSKIRKIAIEVHDPNRNNELIANINKNRLFYFDWFLGSHTQTTYYFS
jgi:23S rRNA U2552 (ribose-2'-O)-methylase RlmE/FtsJ